MAEWLNGFIFSQEEPGHVAFIAMFRDRLGYIQLFKG